MSVITSGDIRICSSIQYEKIISLDICQKVNEHGIAKFTCTINKNKSDLILNKANKDEIVKIEANNKILFAGYINNIFVQEENSEFFSLTVELISTSCKLDQDECRGSYQDVNITYESIVNKIMSKYSGMAICNVGSNKINTPLYQFDETDWEYAIRLASHFGEGVLPSINTVYPAIYFGVNTNRKSIKINSKFYNRCFSSKFYKMNSLLDNYERINYVYYEVKDKHDYEIGSKVDFNYKSLIICEKKAELINEELIYTYVLGKKQLIQFPKIYNDKISGRVINGEVLESNKEKLKVKLDIDSTQNAGSAYEYKYTPFSGNIMYSMPEKGSKVSLYFNNNDSIGTIINCLRTNNSPCTSVDDKKLTTSKFKGFLLNGTEISFKLNVNDESQSYFKLLDDLGITLSSKSKILINAKNEIRIKGIKINTKAPSSIGLYQGNILSDPTYFEIQGDVNTSANDKGLKVTGLKPFTYPMINDEPQEVKFEWGKFLFNLGAGILAALAVAAVAAVAAFLIVGTGGMAAVGIAAAIGGIAVVGAKAKSDYYSGNVDSLGRYLTIGAVGATVGAVSAGLSYAAAAAIGLGSIGAIAARVGIEGGIGFVGEFFNELAAGDDISLLKMGISGGISMVSFGIFNGKNIFNNLYKASGQEMMDQASRNLARSITVNEAQEELASTIANKTAAESDMLAKSVLYNTASENFDNAYRSMIDATAEANLAVGTEEYAEKLAAQQLAEEAYNRASNELNEAAIQKASANTLLNGAEEQVLLKTEQLANAELYERGMTKFNYYSGLCEPNVPTYNSWKEALIEEGKAGVKNQMASDFLNLGAGKIIPDEEAEMDKKLQFLVDKQNEMLSDIDDSRNSDEKYDSETIKEKRKDHEEKVKDNGYPVEEEIYLTRGAILMCSCGTHSRRLDISEDHGYRLYDIASNYPQAFMGDEDKNYTTSGDDSDKNIRFYGICKAEEPPDGDDIILKKDPRLEDDKTGEANVKGKKCKPVLISGWLNAKGDKLLGNAGGYGLTTHSYLVCSRGGFIEPYSSGQEYCGEEDEKE